MSCNEQGQMTPVKIIIRSEIKDVSNESDTQSLLFRCHGTLCETSDQIIVSYQEDPSTDMGNTKTSLVFSKSNPDFLMLAREGDISSTMTFSLENPRHLCTYHTPFAPFSFVTCTKKLDTSVTENGGKVVLDYGVELRGAYAEFHHMSILISPKKEFCDDKTDSECL